MLSSQFPYLEMGSMTAARPRVAVKRRMSTHLGCHEWHLHMNPTVGLLTGAQRGPGEGGARGLPPWVPDEAGSSGGLPLILVQRSGLPWVPSNVNSPLRPACS